MIKVNFGNNVRRETKLVNANMTIREFFNEVGIDYSRGQTNLDGAPIQAGQFDSTFAQLGVTTECYLYNIVKADNA